MVKYSKLLYAAVILTALILPVQALAQEPCAYFYQGQVALALAQEFGLVGEGASKAEAIAALEAVGIFPGALPDVLLPSESEGWEPDRVATLDLFCEQLVYLVYASAEAGLIEADPGDAAGFVSWMALQCGMVCPDPPKEEIIIITPPVNVEEEE